MAYFVDLFSPETYDAFSKSDRTVTGFRLRQKNAALRVNPGDILLCYMTRFSRWVGALEVLSEPFEDDTPIFYEENDPFVVRFKVKPIVWLDRHETVPIQESNVWNTLSFTKDHMPGGKGWTGVLRNSLRSLSDADGELLYKMLKRQTSASANVYPIADEDWNKALSHRIRTEGKTVTVTIPSDDDAADEAAAPQLAPAKIEVRESIKMQALLADVGSRMGFKIWIPKNDRAGVDAEWKSEHKPLLNILPLNYDETTLKTIEQIDVLWLKGRAIMRAFEVEHTTAIYSGILRMADLLALQPNMDIRLHIVAPEERKDKVFQEIRRPVFSLLDRGPLSESCTFLSYDALVELGQLPHLHYLSHEIVDEYTEGAE